MFSLLLPFDRPSALVSPSLTSELDIDMAPLVKEGDDGVLNIRLGKATSRAEGM